MMGRRDFLKTAALATLGTMSAPYIMRAGGTSKLKVGIIGCGGKGESDAEALMGEDIVALCDADDRRAATIRKKCPNARYYKDYRVMLEKEKYLDAVTVSTPDHNHAPAAMMAMQRGLHAFVQKPLVHSVYEAREMRKAAAQYKVATQMGNQGSAEPGLRRAVECIQAGMIGDVKEVHVWSNRPIWPQGISEPLPKAPIPAGVDWDIWLGPAPVREYGEGYLPFNWRGWLDFGTGALGDMACHTCNMPFRALELGYPTSVIAEKLDGANKQTYPNKSRLKFEFPARKKYVPVTFYWYDGGWKPNEDITKDIKEMMDEIPGSGCLMIGTKGQVFSPDDYGAKFYVKMNEDKEFKASNNHEAASENVIPVTIPRSIGHAKEWIEACKGGKPGYSNFDIAAYLTEIILLGCIAIRVGEGKLMEWDGPNMKSPNCPEAAQFVKREYRKGWNW
ncbi:MAG: Gfo/Idh/MocA family oxidoreductase [Verrucomicrobia bacterium]|nr:Gfo/Idh/MocA family oxidoreductase [Verrucomicrobiota bacterium]